MTVRTHVCLTLAQPTYKEIIKFVEAAPSYAAQAEATRLMCRKKYAVLCLRSCLLRTREEGLDAIDLAVEEWRLAFIVGGYCDWLETRTGEDGCAEEFTSQRHLGAGKRYYGLFGGL